MPRHFDLGSTGNFLCIGWNLFPKLPGCPSSPNEFVPTLNLSGNICSNSDNSIFKS